MLRGNNPFGMTGFAAADLGFGLGGALRDQVKDETDEEKKRRQAGMSPLQMPAAQMLLGGGMGYGDRGF